MHPKLSIAITTYRRAEYLRQALESIARGTAEVPQALEVVISDNGPDDEARQVARSFSGLAIAYHRNEENVGPVENVLRACERCTGDYVFFLADDDLVCPGVLTAVLRRVHETPGLGVLASPVEVFDVEEARRTAGRLRFPVTGGGPLLLEKGAPAFEKLFLRATTLSGLAVRRDLLDTEGAREHAASLYPQMYLVGNAAKQGDGYYFDEPLVRVRTNPVAHWQYSHDYMAAAVLDMLGQLTDGEPWGPAVRRNLIRKRVLAAYGPLFEARQASISAFARAVRGLASVPAYRRSAVFWGMVLVIGLLGARVTKMLSRLMPVRPADVVT